ncbi:MAG: hypothetical protein HOM11_00020 [Methylococcales bacterium]|jgi:hypothetical protein|nr:hypothetical protein [Methylococcales bacterium]MBT7444320.1 hypothetical protein [Methylococcales bacterium]
MGLAIAVNDVDIHFGNDHTDGRYQKLNEFRLVKNELLLIKHAQEKLADSVFNNLEFFTTAEEKQEIILILQTELDEDNLEHQTKKQALYDKIGEETERLRHEITDLIGTEQQQGDLIKALVHDLNDVYEGHASALTILGNRYDLMDADMDMQRELLDFVNSIERAERTFNCLTGLLDIASDIQTTEEKIESLLSQALVNNELSSQAALPSLKSAVAQVVDKLKHALANVKEWRDAQAACLTQAGMCIA